MEYTYHITYSCYSHSMQILLNGKTMLSSGSSVWQYMNEPLYRWCDKIFNQLYRELGEIYRVVFTGRMEDAEVLRMIAGQCEYCTGFEVRKFTVDASLQDRMISLSKMIRVNDLPLLPQIKMKAVFIGSEDSIEKW